MVDKPEKDSYSNPNTLQMLQMLVSLKKKIHALLVHLMNSYTFLRLVCWKQLLMEFLLMLNFLRLYYSLQLRDRVAWSSLEVEDKSEIQFQPKVK